MPNKRNRSQSCSSQTSSSSTSGNPQQTKEIEDILRPHILKHLSERQYPKTICPSEVARALLPAQASKPSSSHQCSAEEKAKLKDFGFSSWRDLMPRLRSLSFMMRDEGGLEVLQKGVVIARDRGVEDVRGPIRLRRIEQAVEHESVERGEQAADNVPAEEGSGENPSIRGGTNQSSEDGKNNTRKRTKKRK